MIEEQHSNIDIAWAPEGKVADGKVILHVEAAQDLEWGRPACAGGTAVADPAETITGERGKRSAPGASPDRHPGGSGSTAPEARQARAPESGLSLSACPCRFPSTSTYRGSGPSSATSARRSWSPRPVRGRRRAFPRAPGSGPGDPPPAPAGRRALDRAADRRGAGWSLGEEVGWQSASSGGTGRRRACWSRPRDPDLAASFGPLLSDFSVVVIDEFHERSLHADLAIALARQAAAAGATSGSSSCRPRSTRGPSRTISAAVRCWRFPAGAFPLTSATTRPPAGRRNPAGARAGGGHVLVFLPAPRDPSARDELARGSLPARVLPLHGSLDARAQDSALDPRVAGR